MQTICGKTIPLSSQFICCLVLKMNTTRKFPKITPALQNEVRERSLCHINILDEKDFNHILP
jgi:hypothetical protein